MSEDDVPPSNQLEASQTVPETMLRSRPGAMVLPEVTLLLNTLQVNTAYSLLYTLRSFCCENPGVLDTTSALVQLPPVGDAAQSPYQVPPPPPVWPVPQLPLRGLSLTDDLRSEQEEYAENVYVYHLINAATVLANSSRQDLGEDISVGSCRNQGYFRWVRRGPSAPQCRLHRGTWRGCLHRPSHGG